MWGIPRPSIIVTWSKFKDLLVYSILSKFGIACPTSCQTCDDVGVIASQAGTLNYIK